MTFYILYIALITSSLSLITHTMEQPPGHVADRIINAVKKGDLTTLQGIHRNNPTISFANINLNGMPLIHVVAATDNVSIMDYLIKQIGLNPKTPFHGQTILHTAAQEGSVPMSRYLIEHNIIDKNTTDLRNKTALDIAKALKKFSLINYFVIPSLNPTVTFAQHLKKVGDKKQVLSQFVTPHNHNTQCTICYEEKHFKEFSVLECEHSFCTDCLSQLVTHVISSENTSNLRCPTPTCKKPLEQRDINALIPDTQARTQLNLIQFKTWLMQQPNRAVCPRADCPYIFINERTDKFTMQCPTCDITYCTKCNTQHNAQMTCTEAAENKKIIPDIQEQEKASARWKEQNTRPCPQCKTAIEKTEGCNHMNCQNCAHEFCWQCMQHWQARGHGPFGCSLAPAQPAAAGQAREPQEELSASNAHLFFTRDPIGFRSTLLTPELKHAEFFERFKRLSCEKQDEWSAHVSHLFERSSSIFISRNQLWLDALEIVEGVRSEQQSDSYNQNSSNFGHRRLPIFVLNGTILPAEMGLRFLLAIATNHHDHHAENFQDDLFDGEPS